MGEFDLSLIREFRSRPAFYDRSSPLFKDKIFTAREWQEISNKLGYDVSLLKDRMLQLRNRYNLEKRRLEQLHEENPGKVFESPWPLYQQLHFLSDHIRARRSYKRMSAPLQATAELSNSGSGDMLTTGVACQPFANGLLTVKMETEERVDGGAEQQAEQTATAIDTEHETDSPSISEHDAAGVYNIAQQNAMLAQANLQAHSAHIVATTNTPLPPTTATTTAAALPPSISIRRLETMRQAAANAANAATASNAAAKITAQKRSSVALSATSSTQQTCVVDDADCSIIGAPAAKRRATLNAREQKYAAFGSFMCSSLLELPTKKALLLVEKFTSEVIKLLIQKNEVAANEAASSALVNGADGNLNA